MEDHVEDTEKRSLDNTFLPMTAQKTFWQCIEEKEIFLWVSIHVEQDPASWTLEQCGSRGPCWCLLTSCLDEKHCWRSTCRIRHYIRKFYKLNSTQCVPWRFGGTRLALRWCDSLQATHLYIETIFGFTPLLRLPILRILQWRFHHSLAERLHLRDGGRLLLGQWSETLHQALRHDR